MAYTDERQACRAMAIALTLCSLAVGTPAMSSQTLRDVEQDSLEASRRIIFINDELRTIAEQDSIDHLVASFYYDQFRHFQDPQAPYFLFMSKDATLAMGIGGQFSMSGFYDWSGVMPSSGFEPYNIVMNVDPSQRHRLGSSVSGTKLFFRVIGNNNKIGLYQVVIESNFKGGSNKKEFQLKKAYVTVRDFTVGLAPSTFSDPSAIPPSVDDQGHVSKVDNTAILIRWMHTYHNRWVWALSMEMPDQSVDNGNYTIAASTWMPDYATFIQYEWSRSQHVRLAGIARTLTYRDAEALKNRADIGWGLQLSTVLNPSREVTLYGYINGGKGYGSHTNDMGAGNYDLVPDLKHPGRLYAPASLGWAVGVQYNFSRNLFASTSFAEMRYLPRSGVPGTEYKYGLYGVVNLFWNPIPRWQLGAEFDMGKRQNFDGSHRWAQRVCAQMQFSF